MAAGYRPRRFGHMVLSFGLSYPKRQPRPLRPNIAWPSSGVPFSTRNVVRVAPLARWRKSRTLARRSFRLASVLTTLWLLGVCRLLGRQANNHFYKQLVNFSIALLQPFNAPSSFAFDNSGRLRTGA